MVTFVEVKLLADCAGVVRTVAHSVPMVAAVDPTMDRLRHCAAHIRRWLAICDVLHPSQVERAWRSGCVMDYHATTGGCVKTELHNLRKGE